VGGEGHDEPARGVCLTDVARSEDGIASDCNLSDAAVVADKIVGNELTFELP
jgi:hypothetical protein